MPGRSVASAIGAPEDSFQVEVVPTWELGETDVHVFVMAAGVNYNGIWAVLGQPISPSTSHKRSLPLGRSDASASSGR